MDYKRCPPYGVGPHAIFVTQSPSPGKGHCMELRGLKPRFIAVIVIIYAVVGLVTLCAFYTSTNNIIDSFALRFATKEALLEKNRIISVIDREVVLARKMADDTILRRWALNENDPVLKSQVFPELESYRRFFRDRSFFIALAASNHYYVFNKEKAHEGVEVVTLDAAKPADKWFFEGLKDIGDYVLNLDYNRTLRETKVWINAIMRGPRGEKIGICGGGINITDFLNEIVFSREKGLSTILIDRSGIIQAHEDRSIVEHNANARYDDRKITIFSQMDVPIQQERLKKAIATLTAGRSDVEAFPARVNGRNYLAAVSFMQGVGWFNVVLVDVSSVISMKAFLPIGVTMFLSLLLVIVTIALLMNRMVLVPLVKLTTASREVAGGRYDITLPISGNDEIGELTGTFNSMTSTILDYTNNLEGKVLERTNELSAANRMLEESQHRIMESIRYARIIQASILPDQELRDRCLGDHFVLYRPKEIVGGDFYYLREFPGHFLLAAIDCTGHGVPGAFITMTVNSVLNHVVDVICSDDPARILSELNRVLRQTLKMREVDAGLDIALCMVDRSSGRLAFAGAGLSLCLVSSGTLLELRGDSQRVGYKGSRLDFAYLNRELSVSPGDACYLTTDGLLDESGGEKGYGFGSERFKAMLTENWHRDMGAQLETFERILAGYRGNCPQRDDMTLIGFRL